MDWIPLGYRLRLVCLISLVLEFQIAAVLCIVYHTNWDDGAQDRDECLAGSPPDYGTTSGIFRVYMGTHYPNAYKSLRLCKS